ncbi:AAA family ATPase [Dethiobacter alkaliphilus]|uniref:AAA family ATPase n=1 Tax=Dethiobacter alkaliphilus TaxID=427926 RepID=UPI0022263FA5|nr:AAA family ATPase [Dethiobacter alkaliphilus]MCW3488703.1 AAA family ATPase [Dethiobacter alkaliphilus]
MTEESTPRWVRELRRSLPVKTLFLLHGNIYDQFLYPVSGAGAGQWTYLPLRRLIHRFFREQGYEAVVFYDQVDGIIFFSEEERVQFERAASGREKNSTGRSAAATVTESEEKVAKLGRLLDPDDALDAVRRALAANSVLLAFVLDFSSRLIAAPGHLAPRERQQFVKILKASQEASRKIRGSSFSHSMVLVSSNLSELPVWLYLDNPLAKPLHVHLPQEEERRRYFEMAADGFYNAGSFSVEEKEKYISKFVDLTRGLRSYELESLRDVSRLEQVSFDKPKSLVERYKFGVVESPWEKLGREKGRDRLAGAAEVLRRRVKGQEPAISAVVDIIKRAASGLSGIHHSTSAHKPRGVLFFAGPTGVGKTEMAKSLAEVLFGDESACVRFDMSEYAQEHSDQRLLGAPPGYVGYEEGGQLTNKLKETPFAVLLFDEIEKAHPKIMDKFLQILEDGRMTDGKGETIYFSETVIIFTSNIGAYTDIPAGEGRIVRKPNVLPYSWCCRKCGEVFIEKEIPRGCPKCNEVEFTKKETSYELIREKTMAAVEEHFKLKLGRPEIYNRIGNNFVVFDYIRPAVTEQIIDKILSHIEKEIAEKKEITLVFAPPVKEFLLQRAADNIDQGGRGIGNMIETVVVNPLAGIIFDTNLANAELRVNRILEEQKAGGGVVYRLETAVKQPAE